MLVEKEILEEKFPYLNQNKDKPLSKLNETPQRVSSYISQFVYYFLKLFNFILKAISNCWQRLVMPNN